MVKLPELFHIFTQLKTFSAFTTIFWEEKNILKGFLCMAGILGKKCLFNLSGSQMEITRINLQQWSDLTINLLNAILDITMMSLQLNMSFLLRKLMTVLCYYRLPTSPTYARLSVNTEFAAFLLRPKIKKKEEKKNEEHI